MDPLTPYLVRWGRVDEDRGAGLEWRVATVTCHPESASTCFLLYCCCYCYCTVSPGSCCLSCWAAAVWFNSAAWSWRPVSKLWLLQRIVVSSSMKNKKMLIEMPHGWTCDHCSIHCCWLQETVAALALVVCCKTLIASFLHEHPWWKWTIDSLLVDDGDDGVVHCKILIASFLHGRPWWLWWWRYWWW